MTKQNAHNRFGFKSIIYSSFSVILLMCYFLPQVKMFVGYIQLTLITAAFSAIYIFPSQKNRFLTYGVMSSAAVFCLMMFLFGLPLNFKFGFLHPLMVLWLAVFPALLSYNTIVRNNKWEKRIICFTGVILFFSVIYSTLLIIREQPDIVRNMTGAMDEDVKQQMLNSGVGGYGIAYACGAFSIFLFGLLLSIKNNIWVRLLLLATFLFTLYFVLNAQFATLLLITLISLVAVLFFTLKSNVMRFILVCIAPLALYFLPDILEYIIEIYKGQTIAGRLTGLLNTLQGTSNIENFSGYRSQYQIEALNLFSQSPFWGNDVSGGLNRHIYIASHSQMLAFMAATGLIGTFFYYKAFWNASRIVYTGMGRHMKDILLKPLLIYFILLTMLNPTSETHELYFILFATIPLLINIFVLDNKFNER